MLAVASQRRCDFAVLSRLDGCACARVCCLNEFFPGSRKNCDSDSLMDKGPLFFLFFFPLYCSHLVLWYRGGSHV